MSSKYKITTIICALILGLANGLFCVVYRQFDLESFGTTVINTSMGYLIAAFINHKINKANIREEKEV